LENVTRCMSFCGPHSTLCQCGRLRKHIVYHLAYLCFSLSHREKSRPKVEAIFSHKLGGRCCLWPSFPGLWIFFTRQMFGAFALVRHKEPLCLFVTCTILGLGNEVDGLSGVNKESQMHAVLMCMRPCHRSSGKGGRATCTLTWSLYPLSTPESMVLILWTAS
jgi:hypothetical protein